MPEVDPVNQFQTEKEKAQSSQYHPSCQFKIIHVSRLKRVGDAVIHLISRSAICWTTLPFALIRQPPGPIGTAISILSLSVAQPANPFHPGPPSRGCPSRLRAACTLPVCCPCRLPASWDQGPLRCELLIPTPRQRRDSSPTRNPQPALRTRLDSFIFVRLPAPNRRRFCSQLTTRLSISRYYSPPATMNMTDEELDRDWKPNGRRPQSWVPPDSRVIPNR